MIRVKLSDAQTGPSPAAGPPLNDRLQAVAGTPSGPDGPEQRAHPAEESVEQLRRRAEAAERRVDALERAVESRPCLEQAKGILIGVFGLGADAAFDALAWVSQHSNVKVATVAEQFVVMARELDCGAAHREGVTDLLAVLAHSGHDPGTTARAT